MNPEKEIQIKNQNNNQENLDYIRENESKISNLANDCARGKIEFAQFKENLDPFEQKIFQNIDINNCQDEKIVTDALAYLGRTYGNICSAFTKDDKKREYDIYSINEINPERISFIINLLKNLQEKINNNTTLEQKCFSTANNKIQGLSEVGVFFDVHNWARIDPYKELFLKSTQTLSKHSSKNENFKEEHNVNSIIDTLIDIVEKYDNFNSSYEYDISDILSTNPDYSANKLLKALNTPDQKVKKRISDLLFRLEFGQIGISEEGVKYLEKMYNLGESNNPEYSAQRLTAKGDIGIFDNENMLQKYFNLGDLSNKEKVIKPQIHEFVYSTLFLEKENETPEERKKREKYLEEFKENYFDFYDDKFWQETDVRFNNLDFKEQGWFLIYYKNADNDKKEELLQYAKQYGENGLKTFLSLEFGEEMGEKILSIGEKLSSSDADLVFAQYAEVVNGIEKSKQEFSKEIKDVVVSDEDVNKISEEILKKANCLLVNFADKIEAGEELNQEKVLTELDKYKADILIALSVYKAMQEKIDVEDIKGVKYGEKSASEVSDEELKEKLEIYKKRFEKYPGLQEKVLAEFEKKIKSPQPPLLKGETMPETKVYDYKYKGEEMAFLRIDTEENGVKHFGSFNSALNAKGHAIGLALLEKVFSKIGEDEVVEADCIPSEPISFKYIEKFGFVVTRVEENYADSGMDLFHIERKKENVDFKYRDEKFDLDKIKQEHQNNPENKIQSSTKNYILKFASGDKEITKTTTEATKQNFTMTRYIYDKKNDEVYCCFEKSE